MLSDLPNTAFPPPKSEELGKPNKYANTVIPKFSKALTGLDPYTGTWGKAEAKHLAYRLLFGATKAQIDTLSGLSMQDAVDMILQETPQPAPPLNNYYDTTPDSICPPNQTWVTTGYNPITNVKRTASYRDWWLATLIKQDISIHEKMIVFWHNLFATQITTVQDAQFIYKHHDTLRSNALKNYKDLVLKVSKDPAMLTYLNGTKNQKNKPDENYARELQELFTLGKGPDSKYTEDDVKAAAKILTGYGIDASTETYTFTSSRHDSTNKTFSSFYNNKVITGKSGSAGEDELTELVDMILANDEVAKHIVRKLYRFFVYYVIDETIETNIITPLAETFRTNNYEIKPVLVQLFKSEHFYDNYNRSCIIKNPLDYICSVMKQLEVATPQNSIPDFYTAHNNLNTFSYLLNMLLGEPPNVAGWEAYWNSPLFHEVWINSVTLPYRNQISDLLLSPNGFKAKGVTLKADIFALTEKIPNAEDPNALIEAALDKFLITSVAQKQKDYLKTILLSNQLQDHYWTDAWTDWLNDKTNTTKYNTVLYRLYPFYKYILNLAEYQLI